MWQQEYITHYKQNMAEMFTFDGTDIKYVLICITCQQSNLARYWIGCTIRMLMYTFPDISASHSFDELEPQCVFVRLCQLHVAGPQTRFKGGQELLRGWHRNRCAQVPMAHFLTRTQNKDLYIRRLRSENDSEPKQHCGSFNSVTRPQNREMCRVGY